MQTPQTPALRIVEADAISPAPRDATRPPIALVPTPSEQQRIAEAVAARRAPNTNRAYASQWRRFERYAAERRADALPAAPLTVAAYLTERSAAGASRSTIAQAVASIAAMHRESNLPDPTSDERVRAVRAGLSRSDRRRPKQAAPIDRAAFLQIIEQAASPRPTQRRSVHTGEPIHETSDRAAARAAVDIALLATMRDAMLRVSEAAALRWCDIETAPDGTGRLFVAASKTDQEGHGATLYLRKPTMRYLSAIRPADADDAAPVFRLSARQISRRIKAAAEAAGIDGASSHSARVGMTVDLARSGAGIVETQDVGRWSSPAMPARYAAAELAGTNAVARRMPAED